MPGVVLPLQPSIPNYRLGVALDGTQFVLDVRWNSRDGAWYLDLRDAQAVAIRVGIRVVLGAMLGRRSVDPRFPAGILFAADLGGKDQEAGLDDLGTRVQVYFFTFAEYDALISAAAASSSGEITAEMLFALESTVAGSSEIPGPGPGP
jgi:hypothetical protein